MQVFALDALDALIRMPWGHIALSQMDYLNLVSAKIEFASPFKHPVMVSGEATYTNALDNVRPALPVYSFP
jgi:hypothetical protein